jgi:hypothetical protein
MDVHLGCLAALPDRALLLMTALFVLLDRRPTRVLLREGAHVIRVRREIFQALIQALVAYRASLA